MRLTNPMATLTTTPRRLVAAFLVLLVVGAVATLTLQRASSVLSGTVANSSNTFGAANSLPSRSLSAPGPTTSSCRQR